MASPTTATLTTGSCTCRSPLMIQGSQLESRPASQTSLDDQAPLPAEPRRNRTSHHPGQTLHLPRSLNHPGICDGDHFFLCQEHWVTMDDKLSLTAHIAAVFRSCRFTLFNIRKIRRHLSEHSTQLLVQALVFSKLDYCNSLFGGSSSMHNPPSPDDQNAAACLVFNLPIRSHVTPLLISLHWLPNMACSRFKTLVLIFQAVNWTAPDYIKSLLQPYTPTRHLRSSSDNRLVVPPFKGARSQPKLFSCLAPQWFNHLPT